MKIFKWILSLFKKKVVVGVPKEVPPIPEVKPEPKIEPKVKDWDLFFADISHWEKDFKASEYDKPILINKCTDGVSYVDDTHSGRKKDCKQSGKILYGGYHFYQCYQDPIAQAEHYVKTHGSFDLLPIVDFEKDKNQNESDLSRERENLYLCMKHIQKLTGKVPVLYSYKGLLDQLKLSEKFAEFPLWIARYNQSLGTIPTPWDVTKVLAWQYSDGDYVHFQYPESFKSIGSCDSNIYFHQNDLFKIL